jgi:hypothetical protein
MDQARTTAATTITSAEIGTDGTVAVGVDLHITIGVVAETTTTGTTIETGDIMIMTEAVREVVAEIGREDVTTVEIEKTGHPETGREIDHLRDQGIDLGRHVRGLERERGLVTDLKNGQGIGQEIETGTEVDPETDLLGIGRGIDHGIGRAIDHGIGHGIDLVIEVIEEIGKAENTGLADAIAHLLEQQVMTTKVK